MSFGPHRLGNSAALECDILIIGSGAGGATLADVFTAAGRDVVLLEEGPFVTAENAPTSVPEGLNRLWRCGGLTVGLGNPPVAYAEGRCVGGGTEINSAIMQRAPDQLLDDWAEKYSIRDYGAATFASYYEEAERRIHASLTPAPLGRPSDILKEAGDKLGWQVTTLKRATRDCVSTNLCSISCPTGAKQSMTSTAIPAALARGLRLIAECNAHKIHIKNNTVASVSAWAKDAFGNKHRLKVFPRYVFLCAGAVHTPALLLRSGIKENIGRTLRMHPTIKVISHFAEDISAEHARLPLYAVTQFMPNRRIGGSVFLPGFFAMALAESWRERKALWYNRKNCAMYYAMTRAEAVGTITPLPMTNEPIVRYQCTPQDFHQLELGLQNLAEAMFAAGAKKIIPSITGHEGWTNMDELRHTNVILPKNHTNLMSIHIFSSCPMGENRDICATDSYGRVRGINNLMLADASQIPEAPGVNPQLSVMATALRAADFFLSSSRSECHRLAQKETD